MVGVLRVGAIARENGASAADTLGDWECAQDLLAGPAQVTLVAYNGLSGLGAQTLTLDLVVCVDFRQ